GADQRQPEPDPVRPGETHEAGEILHDRRAPERGPQSLRAVPGPSATDRGLGLGTIYQKPRTWAMQLRPRHPGRLAPSRGVGRGSFSNPKSQPADLRDYRSGRSRTFTVPAAIGGLPLRVARSDRSRRDTTPNLPVARPHRRKALPSGRPSDAASVSVRMP